MSTLPEHLGSPLVFNVYFVDRCSSFCPLSFGHRVVCSSIYRFWLPPFAIFKLFLCLLKAYPDFLKMRNPLQFLTHKGWSQPGEFYGRNLPTDLPKTLRTSQLVFVNSSSNNIVYFVLFIFFAVSPLFYHMLVKLISYYKNKDKRQLWIIWPNTKLRTISLWNIALQNRYETKIYLNCCLKLCSTPKAHPKSLVRFTFD